MDWNPWAADSEQEAADFQMWATSEIRQWAARKVAKRVQACCGEDGQEISMIFRNIPEALSMREALDALQQVGVCCPQHQLNEARFNCTRSKSGRMLVSELVVVCSNNEELRNVWAGNLTIKSKRIVCSRNPDWSVIKQMGKDRMYTIEPASEIQRSKFKVWVQTMLALGLEDFDIREIMLCIFQQHTGFDTSGWDCVFWSESQPRSYQQIWEGSPSIRGQIRVVNWSNSPTRLGSEAAETGKGGAVTSEVSLRACDFQHPQQSMQWCIDCQVQVNVKACKQEVMVIQENAVSIIVLQVNGKADKDMPFQMNRIASKQAADIASLIQQRHCRDGPNFTEDDFSFWMEASEGQSARGVLSLRKRQSCMHDADIITMAVLAFLIGGAPKAPFMRWDPIGVTIGQSVSGVASINARIHPHGQARREIQVGYRSKGMATWNMHNPRDGTIRRLQRLLTGKPVTDDLLSILKSPRWERKSRGTTGVFPPRSRTSAIKMKCDKGWPHLITNWDHERMWVEQSKQIGRAHV